MTESSEYLIPKKCEQCDSENIAVRVKYDKGITRYVCLDCNYSRSVPKSQNLNKRTNSTLHSWHKRVIKHHPFCVICGSKENLEAHHIIPVSHAREFTYEDTNGITLCQKCHYLVHHKGKEYDDG